MADFQSWLRRNKIGLWDTALNTQTGHMRRSRMSNRPMMTSSQAMDKYQEELYGNAMLQRGISEAVGRAFGEDRKAELARENQMLRSTLGQYRQATGGLARDLQRVGVEKQGVTSPELDPYQMARQIPGMERKGALTSTAAGAGAGGGMDLMGMGYGEPTDVEPVTTSIPGLTTGESLPLAPMATEDESVAPLASGGPLQRGAVHMVGEAGRELVVPRGDGGYQVIPNPQTEAVMATGGVNSPLIRHACGGRIKHHEGGGTIDNPNRELRPMENLRTIANWVGLGDAGGGQEAVMEPYPGYALIREAPSVDTSVSTPPVEAAPATARTPYYDREFRPVETARAVLGMEPSLRYNPPGGYPGAGTALPPATSVQPGMPTTPGAYTRASEAVRSAAGAGAETDRPAGDLGNEYYYSMARQWDKPSAATAGPPMRRVDFSAPLARSRGVPGVTPLGSRGETEVIGSGYEGQPTPISRRNDVFYQQMGDAAEKGEIVEVRYGPNDVKYFNPAEYGPGRPFRSPEAAKRGGEVWEVSGKPQQPTTLIRGTNVTYAAPGSITGEQEFSTPQMTREAQRYTPGVQEDVFKTKLGAMQQLAKNLSTSPVADARMYAAMVRDQAARNALAANLEERTSRESGGKGPTLTMGPHGRPITHPQYLPIAVSELANEAKKAPDDLWAGVNLVNRMQSLISGHPKDKQQEMVQQFQAALPANLAKRLRDYYASKNPQ